MRREFEEHDLCDFFDTIWKELPHAYDVLDYHGHQLPYDDVGACMHTALLSLYHKIMQALAISKLMSSFLNDGRQIYLKTMTNLSYQRKVWELSKVEGTKCQFNNIVLNLHSVEELTKEYLPGHDSIIGEYNNVAVLMCQQYIDQFPKLYIELEKTISPQYMVSKNIVTCLILILIAILVRNHFDVLMAMERIE